MQVKLIIVCAFAICAALTCNVVRADGVIPVVNASFEQHDPFTAGCTAKCGFNSASSIPGWTVTGSADSFQPNFSFFTLPLSDGKVVAYSIGGTISQDSGLLVQANPTHNLLVDVGHRLDGLVTNYSVALHDGSTSLCATPTASNGSITAGTFLDVTLTCTTGVSATPGDLSIVLTAGGGRSNSTTSLWSTRWQRLSPRLYFRWSQDWDLSRCSTEIHDVRIFRRKPLPNSRRPKLISQEG